MGNVLIYSNLDYYLLCDALGKAWSFGSNRKHCLGFADIDKYVNTYDPKEIAYFRKKHVFVVDVSAGA